MHLIYAFRILQVEANQPVMRTVGNISTAIAQSDFGNSVHNSVRVKFIIEINQFTYDYFKLKIGYFSNWIPVWEGIFTLENLT